MSNNLASIKERMSSMKLDIDASNQVIRQLQTELEQHTQRAEEAEETTAKLNIQYRDLEDRKSDMEDELRGLKLKIDEIESESDENSRFSRVLEMRENTNSDRLRELQTLMTQQTSEIERLDRVNSDLQSKSQQMEDRLEDAEEKGIRLKSILDDNQEELNQLRNNYKSLLAQDKKMTEKLDKCEHESFDKDNRLKETSCRAEAAEKSCNALTNRMQSLEDELEEWKDRISTCRNELNQTLAEIGDI